MKRRDLGSAIFLLAFGLLAVFEARKLTLGTPGRPGAGFFPFSLGLALCGISVALVARAWLLADGKAPAGAAPVEQPEVSARLQWPKIIYTLLAMLVYAFLLDLLGFLATTVLLLLFLLRTIEPQRWPVAVGVSVASAVGAYGLFKWLGVRLPPGLWPL